MPPPTASQKPGPKANGGAAAGSTAAKAKAATAAPASTPSAGAASGAATSSGGKPDKSAYDAEQDALNNQIADVKAKLVRVLSGHCRRSCELTLPQGCCAVADLAVAGA